MSLPLNASQRIPYSAAQPTQHARTVSSSTVSSAAINLIVVLVVTIALHVASAQGFDCAPCATNGTASVCCACCVGGVLQPGLCNDAAHTACVPPPTPSNTASQSASSSTSQTSTFTPIATPIALPAANNAVAFTEPCAFAYWQVPPGVTNITIRAWGGGGGLDGGWLGGGGAFVATVCYVTPGELLRVNSGAGASAIASESCGWPGVPTPGCFGCTPAGGFSSVSRVYDSVWEYMLVAGGGGGASGYWTRHHGGYGVGIPPNGCGAFQPYGLNQGLNTGSSGGGGGWIGGNFGNDWQLSGGGTSCTPGCIPEFTQSLNGTQAVYSAVNSRSLFYRQGFGGPAQPGLVVIAWDGPNPSETGTPAQTTTPTVSPSNPATATPSASLTAGATPSTTPSSTGTPYCHPYVFRTFLKSDLVGTPIGEASFVASERDCQLACCSTPGCVGYVFEALQILRGGSTAACLLDGNVTQLMPSSLFSSGVLASFYPS